MHLASQGDVPLGWSDGLIELAVAKELADLGT
jgi:hypothetical protein